MSQEDYKEDSDLGNMAEDMPDMMDETLFWSMTLEPTKSHEIGQPAIDGYVVHITNACFGADVSKQSRTVVTVSDQEKAIPVCILRQGHHENHSLDLLFNEAATITLTGHKVSTVYLTGYIQPPLDMNENDAVMDEDMTEAEIMEALKKQRRQQMLLDDEVFDDEDNQQNKNKKQAEKEEVDDDEDSEDSDSEEEEEEEEVIEEVAEEEVVEPPTKKQKTNKGSKSTKNGSKSEKKRKNPAPKAKAKAKAVQKSVQKEDDTKEEEEKVVVVEKKNKGKNKKNKGKKDKKLQAMKGGQGLKYRDMKVGEGAEVSVGDKLSVFYVGQTEDKKVFDKAIKGSGFEFNFGKGDVIKGWDMGLKGMKVGGKRKLVIPPKLAYGANGSPPSVPGNATLTFTIELKAVN